MSEIITSCRDCVFALYKSGTQEDCTLDRIDKFEQNGAEIVGIDDGKKRYLTIVGRRCNTRRPKDWGKRHNKNQWVSIVRKETEIKLDVVIHLNSESTIDELIKTVQSAVSQEIQPHSLLIVCQSEHLVLDIVEYLKSNIKLRWRVESIDPLKAVSSCTGNYYAVFHAGYVIPSDFIYNINKTLNYDLKRFVIIEPDGSGNGLVAQQCGKQVSIADLLEMAEKTNTTHMITSMENLCQ